jgi:DNA-binding MarR family transcriptional regulator
LTIAMTDPDKVHETAMRLQHLATRMLRLARSQRGKEGVGSAQYSAMAVLYDRGPLSLGELARAERVSHPTMSRVVAGLVKRGAARRLDDAADKRLRQVALTAEGRALYEHICATRVAVIGAVLAQLKPQTVSELVDVVEKTIGPLEAGLRQG